MNNIVYLKDFANKKVTTLQEKSVSSNVVQEFFDNFVDDYKLLLEKYNVNVNDDKVAFDIASVQFFVKGMAHRMLGEHHPSHTILNSMRNSITGN